MDLQKTSMKKNEENIDKVFQNNNIIIDNYKYIDYDVNSIVLQCSIYDLKNLLNQKAKLRENFSVDNDKKIINLPNFFVKINGAFENKKDWSKFKSFIEKDACVFYDFSFAKYNFSKDFSEEFRDNAKKYLFKQNLDAKNELLTLADLYKKEIEYNNIFDILNQFMLNYILRKLDNFIKEGELKENFSKKIYIDFMTNVLFMDNNLLRKLNEWDFSSNLPRVVIYDEYEKYSYNETNYLLVDFLNYIGVDVLIISSSGKSNIESFDFVLNNNLYTNIVLDKFLLPSKKKKQETKENRKLLGLFFCLGIGIIISALVGIFLVNEANNNRINAIKTNIDSIDEVSYSDYEKITRIRNAYDDLSDKNKNKVTNYDKFENIESQYEDVRSDKIKEVEELISSINSASTDDEKSIIRQKAQKEYFELRKEDAKEVENANELNSNENIFTDVYNNILDDTIDIISRIMLIIIPLSILSRTIERVFRNF